MLDYEASGEFSKYLEEVKIVEHEFNEICFKYGRFGKEKLKPSDSFWKALFKFSEIPKRGQLIINFM